MGQHGLFPDAVKKVGAQLLLKLLDLDGDGGLGIAELLRSAGKAV